MSTLLELPIPSHFDADKVVDLRFIDYKGLAAAATDWRAQHELQASANDGFRIGLLVIDNQYTFCHPNGELFVAGRSGRGAIDDSGRLATFMYRNLANITAKNATFDTHWPYAIFQVTFVVDKDGNHPVPFTTITLDDVLAGRWQVTPHLCSAIGINNMVVVQKHLEHYCRTLKDNGRYDLTMWPFHGMLGGAGHPLVSGVEEAFFFHSIARGDQPRFEIKGGNALTENYSVLGPEVRTNAAGKAIAQRNTKFIEQLLEYDVLIIAGQAKSHCVAWTIDDLLADIVTQDPALARKVCILEDCTSAVTVPDDKGGFLVDYTDQADAAFERFREAGMHLVQSTVPMKEWDVFQAAA